MIIPSLCFADQHLIYDRIVLVVVRLGLVLHACEAVVNRLEIDFMLFSHFYIELMSFQRSEGTILEKTVLNSQQADNCCDITMSLCASLPVHWKYFFMTF